MTKTIKQRPDENYDVFEDGRYLAGPFYSHSKAREWIESSDEGARVRWEDLPDDIRRSAKVVETTYMQRGGTDLATMVAIAIAEERLRCRNLALSMKSEYIEKGAGLVRQPSFADLAEKIRKGDA